MSPLASLGRSWLAPPPDAAEEVRAAYTELLLLNVYPYASVYRDLPAELNGPSSQWVAGRFAATGFAPRELTTAAAPDHVGLCLGYLDHTDDPEFLRLCLEWIPVWTLAVEREPAGESFYASLARETREELLARMTTALEPLDSGVEHRAADSAEEVRLFDVVQYLLSPAECGFFLSRSRLGRIARQIGLRLPFNSRFDVAQNLFASAGEAARVPELLASLGRERDGWDSAYEELARVEPGWAAFADCWRRRTASAKSRLGEMNDLLAQPLDLITP